MQKASIDNMELGNLLFGNSRGNYQIDRTLYSDMFHSFLENNGFDTYGYHKNTKDGVFENNVFIVRPYYWGDDETIAELPNFEFKPENIQISWYKYPLRDAYCSHDISPEQLKTILDICAESMGQQN